MRIKHSIVRNGCTLSGQILETVFEEGEKRGDSKSRYSKDENFQVISYEIPELYRSTLYVW